MVVFLNFRHLAVPVPDVFSPLSEVRDGVFRPETMKAVAENLIIQLRNSIWKNVFNPQASRELFEENREAAIASVAQQLERALPEGECRQAFITALKEQSRIPVSIPLSIPGAVETSRAELNPVVFLIPFVERAFNTSLSEPAPLDAAERSFLEKAYFWYPAIIHEQKESARLRTSLN
ncbi:hypothetical protein EBR96_02485, partial [bacterium]|nr:hypothetical protein [bacterium]